MRGVSGSLALCLLVALGCDDDRLRIDAGPQMDAGARVDAGGVDAGANADAGPLQDSGPTDASATLDSGSDAGPPVDGGPLTPTGPVQCRVNSDCASGMCERHWPGGICANVCPGTCPTGFVCQDPIPACVRACSGPQDCNVGMECRGTGRCGSLSCTTDGPDVCAPYICNGAESRCERPRCVGGGSCPNPFVCVDDFCVEPQ